MTVSLISVQSEIYKELPKSLHISGPYHILKWFFDNSWTFFETSFNALQEWRLVINSSMSIPNQPSLMQTKFTYEQITDYFFSYSYLHSA